MDFEYEEIRSRQPNAAGMAFLGAMAVFVALGSMVAFSVGAFLSMVAEAIAKKAEEE